ncbi:MAG: XisI protein [Trichodesmium erythraeum GBRTRLIN201]|nr:XisI protein [Trichodesmium erythraeum GBRTRLIN201]
MIIRLETERSLPSTSLQIVQKIWVQHDGTEDAIADQLVEKGVPAEDIVLAYHPPLLRKYTEFAES